MYKTCKNHKKSRLGRIIFMLTAAFAIAGVITASLLFTAGTTEGKEAVAYKRYYSSMTVSADDTLWSLGKRYSGDQESQKEYAGNIMKLNNMTDDTLYEGMNIVYYYYVASE